MNIRSLTSILLLSVAFPRQLEGQAGSGGSTTDRTLDITGEVVDHSTGRAIPSAYVAFGPADERGRLAWTGTSNTEGQFRTGRLPLRRYDVSIEAVGFTRVSHVLDLSEDGLVHLRVEMAPEALELEPLVVTATRQSRLETAGFFERRQVGLGHTLTRAEIESRGPPSRVSELFHGIPGMRVLPPQPGRGGMVLFRDGCVPRVILDGKPISFPIPIDELLSIGELEAVEVYQGASTPVQFLGYGCGTVVAWTREMNKLNGHAFSWRRLFGAVGLLSLLVLMSPR